MSDDDPTRLGASLERFFRNLGAPPLSVLSQLDERWPDIVGPALATTTRPIELVDGTLVVGCSDAAWANQVSWMEKQLVDRFAEEFGEGLLKRISTRVDRS